MRPPVLLVDVHSDRDVFIVAPHGEVDIATVERVDRALQGGEDRQVIVLDLRGVTFMDSAGLGLVVRHHRRAERAGCAFRLVPGSSALRRLFALTGLEARLNWCDPSGAPLPHTAPTSG